MTPPQTPGSPRKKRRTSSETSTAPIDFDKAVRTLHDTDPHAFVRVGDFEDRTQAEPNDIPVEYPLIAETDLQAKTIVDFWRTDAWDYGQVCTGDLELSKKRKTFSKYYEWGVPYQGVKRRCEVQQRIFRPVDIDLRLPFLPSLTFNVFDPTATVPPMGVETLGKGSFPAVIRFVSHLQQPKTEKLDFYDNYQITVDDSDDTDTILAQVDQDLRQRTSKLFEKPLRDTWVVDLWVLPQTLSAQKLFRFGNGRAGSSATLRDFVSQQMLVCGHRKLYMEAHFWPM